MRDNGTGIAPEMMDRIFNPFFTTEDTKWNTGLGLSLSYDIVRKHGGIIIPESKHGEYTEMTVILPHTKKADADYDVGRPTRDISVTIQNTSSATYRRWRELNPLPMFTFKRPIAGLNNHP